MQLKTLYAKAVYDYDWHLNDVKNKETTGPTHSGTAASEPVDSGPDETPAPTDNQSTPPPTSNGTETPSAPLHPDSKDLGK
jgi:hypothetical protein